MCQWEDICRFNINSWSTSLEDTCGNIKEWILWLIMIKVNWFQTFDVCPKLADLYFISRRRNQTQNVKEPGSKQQDKFTFSTTHHWPATLDFGDQTFFFLLWNKRWFFWNVWWAVSWCVLLQTLPTRFSLLYHLKLLFSRHFICTLGPGFALPEYCWGRGRKGKEWGWEGSFAKRNKWTTHENEFQQ